MERKSYLMRKSCKYCHQPLKDHPIHSKFGDFCSQEHFDDYLKNLSHEDYIKLQHSFCVCSDET